MNELKICRKCLMLSTRPRLTFNENGVCSACQWAEEKKTLDWGKRKTELERLCDKYRKNDGAPDVIVPVSGGKDSSMVAHRLKNEWGMHPLCINVSHSPEMNTEMNEANINSFVKQGFSTLRLYPNPVIERKLDKAGLVEWGQPYLGWMSAMLIAPLKIAARFGIPLIMYGEEGEVEYGGSTELKNQALYTMDHIKRLYLSGIDMDSLAPEAAGYDRYWWIPPTEGEIDQLKPAIAHWSYFYNWNSNENYRYARDHVGLNERRTNSIATYNAFAQTDSKSYPLHAYFMYLKFGFGRCTQDVCIDIRSGEMTREKGIELIRELDEQYPEVYEEDYLKYYDMSREDFLSVIDRFANKELLEKENGYWKKRFDIAEL